MMIMEADTPDLKPELENVPEQAVPLLAPNATTPFDRNWPGAPIDPTGVMSRDFVYPGLDGLPFRGVPPTIKEDDPHEKRPQIGMQTHVRVLELDKPEDLKLYTIYSPPNHPDGTVHATKAEADAYEAEEHK